MPGRSDGQMYVAIQVIAGFLGIQNARSKRCFSHECMEMIVMKGLEIQRLSGARRATGVAAMVFYDRWMERSGKCCFFFLGFISMIFVGHDLDVLRFIMIDIFLS